MNHPSPLHHDVDAKLPAAAYLRYESRADGWSPGRQAAFLSHLADNGLVEDAARSVGMSVGGGYSLRRTARGYAFNLGWEAALIIARRVISDRLMTAAIKGEEARWVREEGVTTYTRQNTKLSLALLDRVNPATTLSEVMAVATRFDWFLQLIDEGASAEELWDLFFEDALPHSDIEARARVRQSLLLCEESAGFDEEEDEDEDEAPIEYKSMDGPPTPDGQPRKAHSPSSATSAPLREPNFSSRRGAENAESLEAARRFCNLVTQRTNEATTAARAKPFKAFAEWRGISSVHAGASRGTSLGRWVSPKSPLSEMPALDQRRPLGGLNPFIVGLGRLSPFFLRSLYAKALPTGVRVVRPAE